MRLDRAKFTRWLAAKSPSEIVGQNRDCHGCPIAHFYQEASGGCEVIISDDPMWGGHIIDRGYNRRKLPEWASAFVFLVDGDGNGKITAGRALEALNEIY